VARGIVAKVGDAPLQFRGSTQLVLVFELRRIVPPMNNELPDSGTLLDRVSVKNPRSIPPGWREIWSGQESDTIAIRIIRRDPPATLPAD
jgi:hypothetical protein